MLCNIDYDLIEDARRILTLLYFAVRPLTVRELIDGVVVKINNPLGLNYNRRLQTFNDLYTICLGLIDISLGTSQATETDHADSKATIQIAHVSVQEHLESERIRHQKVAKFSLTSLTAYSEIAQICLVYLFEHGLSSSQLDQIVFRNYLFANSSAMHWDHYFQDIIEPTIRPD